MCYGAFFLPLNTQTEMGGWLAIADCETSPSESGDGDWESALTCSLRIEIATPN